ncbi:MAG: hypothetical protein EAZ30_03415 [Betaproteobacteria bacterium]|nr:MAG: hypothetical protein EAZ30_03415 [Betaproteobacteria bacterium]
MTQELPLQFVRGMRPRGVSVRAFAFRVVIDRNRWFHSNAVATSTLASCSPQSGRTDKTSSSSALLVALAGDALRFQCRRLAFGG